MGRKVGKRFARRVQVKFDAKFLKYLGPSGAKAYKSCGSRQELSNAYLFAEFGIDTAENEPYRV